MKNLSAPSLKTEREKQNPRKHTLVLPGVLRVLSELFIPKVFAASGGIKERQNPPGKAAETIEAMRRAVVISMPSVMPVMAVMRRGIYSFRQRLRPGRPPTAEAVIMMIGHMINSFRLMRIV